AVADGLAPCDGAGRLRVEETGQAVEPRPAALCPALTGAVGPEELVVRVAVRSQPRGQMSREARCQRQGTHGPRLHGEPAPYQRRDHDADGKSQPSPLAPRPDRAQSHGVSPVHSLSRMAYLLPTRSVAWRISGAPAPSHGLSPARAPSNAASSRRMARSV